MDIDFTGKKVVVTGAGKGIGKDICLLLASLGAHVIAISRTKADLDALAKEINGCTTIVADLGDGISRINLQSLLTKNGASESSQRSGRKGWRC